MRNSILSSLILEDILDISSMKVINLYDIGI